MAKESDLRFNAESQDCHKRDTHRYYGEIQLSRDYQRHRKPTEALFDTSNESTMQIND